MARQAVLIDLRKSLEVIVKLQQRNTETRRFLKNILAGYPTLHDAIVDSIVSDLSDLNEIDSLLGDMYESLAEELSMLPDKMEQKILFYDDGRVIDQFGRPIFDECVLSEDDFEAEMEADDGDSNLGC